ncbi:uS10/mL48 family ribosomal protein [Haladaptatus sp. DYSN1]|uniref:uS10/mL48 family ribosomal protein n=1 Tax=unclassified Haladaptatus TaxID=2622732 RepID=UPI002407342F|nr:uS10/mL48 family ribosomal protein [Haladaptatus sp. DYSN1]
MSFTTTLTLTSGDRTVLDEVVTDIKRTANRKGAALHGPHTKPTEVHAAPQAKRLHPTGDSYPQWEYTVYTRVIEIEGHDDFARAATQWDFPAGVHVEAEIKQVRAAGR